MKVGPELVVGLVGAVGCDLPGIAESFVTAFREVGYDARSIRLSHRLHDLEPWADLATVHDQEKYIDGHMDAGNELRGKTSQDVMALLGMAQIRVLRQHDGIAESENDPRPRAAYILNSLKRPEEVTKLREIYGSAFLLVSAYASRDRRRESLALRIARSKNEEIRECIWRAEKLMARDEIESLVKTGQDVRDTFPLADVFLNADDKGSIDDSVRRTVSILFAHPFETPTIDEMGMQHAYGAALRSADLSRQVGYSACTSDGQLLAVGTNEVAKAGGGFYWPSSENDARDFRVVESDEPNAEMKLSILKELLEDLKQQGLLTLDDVSDETVSEVAKKLKGGRFMSITEYGRAVHAEMGVVTDAARRGVSLHDATMYGTTFPCHNCAKHVVAAGIRRLVYIEPYPKSQVARLFRDSIDLDGTAQGKVHFQPFVGIAPPRFREFFVMGDRKSAEGRIMSWDESKQSSQPRIQNDPQSYIRRERNAVEQLGKSLADAGVRFRES